MKRILIVNPFGIGDVLFTTPLIANLKEAYPDAYIGYVCNARTKDILLNNPKVNTIFIYEKDAFRRVWRKSKTAGFLKFMKLLRSIRNKKFDIVFDLSLGREYGFFLWLAGIKKRVGYNYRNRGIFLTDTIDIAAYDAKHIVRYYLELLRRIGLEPRLKALEFPISEKDEQWAGDYLREQGVAANDMIIGLIPGGGASWGASAYKKQWQPHRFAQLAAQITARFGTAIMLLGDDHEVPLCNQIASLIREMPIMACGATTLSRFAALLKRCELVICNDGGPLHIAVSQGVKTISIFGPVDPLVYGPYPRDENNIVVRKGLVCQPCYERFKMRECGHADCLTTLEVKDVMAAVDRFLANGLGGA